MIKIALMEFPGTNCERETAMALRRSGMEPTNVLWNDADADLSLYDGFVIPGGFSYEDRVRSGLIAAMSPMLDKLKAEDRAKKPIWGICNGAQILVESGIVPGYRSYPLAMALAQNRQVVDGNIVGTGYYNAWVNVRSGGKPLRIPIAHGEGRFVIPPNVLSDLEESRAQIWRYCDEGGAVVEGFPTNPNGSQGNIAGIGNFAGNALAFMPHPERAPAGDSLFASLREFCSEPRDAISELPEPPFLNPPDPKKYEMPSEHMREVVVESLITDDAALTLESALRRQGLPVSLKRYQHWSLRYSRFDEQDHRAILKSSELLNEAKERPISLNAHAASEDHFYVLVREKSNTSGQAKRDVLKRFYGIDSIQDVQRGDLWRIECPPSEKQDLKSRFSARPILFNPHAHEHFVFE